MKKYLLFFSMISINYVGFAQQDDAYKAALKITSVTIHKAQKEIISGQKTSADGLLAKAVILQNNAIALYKTNNNNRAICMTALARKYAALLIKDTEGYNDYYLIHDNEKILINNCDADELLYEQSKTFAHNPSENDADYLHSLNKLTIDIK